MQDLPPVLPGALQPEPQREPQPDLQQQRPVWPDADRMPDGPVPVVYFDGTSSRRHVVDLTFNNQLNVRQAGEIVAAWPYDDIRRADAPVGVLRASCKTAPPLARLEIRDDRLAAELLKRCLSFDQNAADRRGTMTIIGWSVAAAVSIILIVLFGVPLVADRLTPLVPQSLERRLGEVADLQIKALFGGKVCASKDGQAAFLKLVNTLREVAGVDTSVDAAVVSSFTSNAFALPGGKIYVFKGLLDRADNADELAGVLAHEIGHLKNRDNLRLLIHNGGTSFLIGLLFGDITGSGAMIFATRTLFSASYSRDVETKADTSTIAIMHKLGRSPRPMGELMLRVTGKQQDGALSILKSHPLTQDRLAHMKEEDRPVNGPPLLTAAEWAAVKAICRSEG